MKKGRKEKIGIIKIKGMSFKECSLGNITLTGTGEVVPRDTQNIAVSYATNGIMCQDSNCHNNTPMATITEIQPR